MRGGRSPSRGEKNKEDKDKKALTVCSLGIFLCDGPARGAQPECVSALPRRCDSGMAGTGHVGLQTQIEPIRHVKVQSHASHSVASALCVCCYMILQSDEGEKRHNDDNLVPS